METNNAVGARAKAVVGELTSRKLLRNTLLAILCLALVYVLYPGNGSGRGVSTEIMRGFRPTDPVAGVPLRILPIGDSITEGYGSVDGNSYRLALLHALAIRGVETKYVGTLKTGSMDNNEHDGFWGRTIIEVAAASKPTWEQKPNVVLLHVGTNDMNLDPPREPYDSAPQRLGALLDDLTGTIPNVTVLIAQIIQSRYPETSQRIPKFNAAIPELVAARTAKGAKILTVDMSKIGADSSTSDDKLHPNDAGYQLMSVVWLRGLQAVTKKGWITKPVE